MAKIYLRDVHLYSDSNSINSFWSHGCFAIESPFFTTKKFDITRATFFHRFFLLYCCCVRRHCRMADLSIQIPKSTFQITDEGRNLVFCFLCAKCTQNFKCATLTLTHIDWVRVSLGWRGHLFPLRFTCSLTKKKHTHTNTGTCKCELFGPLVSLFWSI